MWPFLPSCILPGENPCGRNGRGRALVGLRLRLCRGARGCCSAELPVTNDLHNTFPLTFSSFPTHKQCGRLGSPIVLSKNCSFLPC